MLPLLSRRAQDLPHFSANLASIFSTATAKVWNVFWSMPPSPTETWPSNRAKNASFALAPPGLCFSGLLERALERLRRPLLRDRLRSFWLMHRPYPTHHPAIQVLDLISRKAPQMFADFNLVLLLQGAQRGHRMPVEFPLAERPVVLALP